LLTAVSVTAILTVTVLCILLHNSHRRLVVRDYDTGKVFLKLDADECNRFSVGYVHSVNKTPVVETYEIRDCEIYVVEGKFYNFGAGMQTEYPDGVTYTYADDGAIIASGYNIYCKDLIYCVGMWSDHILEFNGNEYSLRDICGRGTMVEFKITKGKGE